MTLAVSISGPARTNIICVDEKIDPYSEAEVDYLRTMHYRTDDGRARADEITGVWERHREARLAPAAYLGCSTAEAAFYRAVDAHYAIGDAIVAARTTLHGLAVRARIVASFSSGDPDDDILPTGQKMLLAIVRDLTAVAF